MEEDGITKKDSPVYNIKAISRLVGLLPVTLRAWERRYGMPSPRRGEKGYRLYSEYDLHTLRWLKSQLETGLNIGRAIEFLHLLRQTGRDPAVLPTKFEAPLVVLQNSPSIPSLYQEFMDSLLNFNEAKASDVLRRSFALYSVDEILMEVITPTLVKLGEMWHSGQLQIAVEHFATQFCMQYLMSMVAASAPPSHPGLIVAACAPGENHQIGLLMLVVMLRWRGWNVKYLGPDLKLDRLGEALGPFHPSLLMFSANRIETANNLIELPATLEGFPHPKPRILVGGQAFQQMRLPQTVSVEYINASPVETIKVIETLMVQQGLPYDMVKEK